MRETASRVDDVEFKDVHFPGGKNEFVLITGCVDQEKSLEWREKLLPPAGAEESRVSCFMDGHRVIPES